MVPGAGVTPLVSGHQAMLLAARDEGVSIKISANLMTLQRLTWITFLCPWQ